MMIVTKGTGEYTSKRTGREIELSSEQIEFLKKLEGILDKRYGGCNEKGHQQPDNETSTCRYCHRRLEYKNDIPKGVQERVDRLFGLSMLTQELERAYKLKKAL